MIDMVGYSRPVSNSQRPLINIFTCANRKYQDFAILFALASLQHVEGSVVEIGLEDPEGFASDNKQALSLLEEEFGPGRVILRGARFRFSGRRIPPGAVRFIETPSECDYVYISDIDIITLDPTLVDAHVAFMKRRNLPYSNSSRAADRSRMSGLHFARYDDWYPLPFVDDLLSGQFSDEQVLRIICERKGFHVQHEEWFRPMHGIHVSPNRSPFAGIRNGVKTPGWGIGRYIAAYRKFASSQIMKEMYPLFGERIRAVLEEIESVCSASASNAGHEVNASVARTFRPEGDFG